MLSCEFKDELLNLLETICESPKPILSFDFKSKLLENEPKDTFRMLFLEKSTRLNRTNDKNLDWDSSPDSIKWYLPNNIILYYSPSNNIICSYNNLHEYYSSC